MTLDLYQVLARRLRAASRAPSPRSDPSCPVRRLSGGEGDVPLEYSCR
jgi:hypothetical protein